MCAADKNELAVFCDSLRARLLSKFDYVTLTLGAAALAVATNTLAVPFRPARLRAPWWPGQQGATRTSEAAPSARDHDVAGSEMLHAVIDDRAHAFGNRNILDFQALDTGVAIVVLHFPINEIVGIRTYASRN